MEWKRSETAAAVQRTTELLDTTVEFVEQDLTYDLRRHVPNALLNIALSRLIGQEGRDGARRVLTALAAAVASGADPDADGPVRFADTRHDGHSAGETTEPEAARRANVVQMR